MGGELTEEMKKTCCRKCSWCKDGWCPYTNEYNAETNTCRLAEHYKSAYWRKNDREAEEAARLGKLVLENGIEPKYKIGDKVWCVESFGLGEDYPKEYIIRKILASEDGTSYRYQVKGHTEYTFGEECFFLTEDECMKEIVKRFVERTIKKAKRLSEECGRLGIDMGGALGGLLESKKD